MCFKPKELVSAIVGRDSLQSGHCHSLHANGNDGALTQEDSDGGSPLLVRSTYDNL